MSGNAGRRPATKRDITMATSKSAPTITPAAEPLAVPIPEAGRYSGLTRSGIYRGLARGEIHAVKCGSRTLVLMDSLRAYIAGLPAATFRRPNA